MEMSPYLAPLSTPVVFRMRSSTPHLKLCPHQRKLRVLRASVSCHPLEDWPASQKIPTKSSVRTVMLNIATAMASVLILTPGLGVMVAERGIILLVLGLTVMRFGGLISTTARNVSLSMGTPLVSYPCSLFAGKFAVTDTSGDKQ